MPTGATDLSHTARDLRIAVGRIGRRLRDLYATMATPGEVGFSEVSLLSRLRREGPTSPGTLADAEHVTPQAVGSVLSAMHGKGLIDRTADPSDGRRIIVSLTDAGERAFDHRSEEVSARLARVLVEAFDAGERAQLADAVPLLERLADRL